MNSLVTYSKHETQWQIFAVFEASKILFRVPTFKNHLKFITMDGSSPKPRMGHELFEFISPLIVSLLDNITLFISQTPLIGTLWFLEKTIGY